MSRNIHFKVLEAIKNPNITEFDATEYLAEEDVITLFRHCPLLESLSFSGGIGGLGGDYFSALKVKKLTIQFCSFSTLKAIAPIMSMSSLTHLTMKDWYSLKDLSQRNYDQFFEKISQFPNLIYLDFSGYKIGITDHAIKLLSSLTQLKTLYLGYNPCIFDTGIKHLIKLQNLENFSIESTYLTDKSCNTLSMLFNLKSLQLKGTEITDKGLQYLCRLTNLKSLYLGDCPRLSNNGFQHLSLLKSLINLEFCQNCNIDNFALCCLRSLQGLKSLVLTGCNLITHEGIRCISDLPQLEALDLSFCLIDQECLSVISEMKNLRVLHLNNCPQIDDNALTFFTHLLNITEIKLNECTAITDRGLESLSSIQSLQILELNWNPNITDQGLARLYQLPKLKNFSIRGCPQINKKWLNQLSSSDIQIKTHIHPKVYEAIKKPTIIEFNTADYLSEQEIMTIFYYCPRLETLTLSDHVGRLGGQYFSALRLKKLTWKPFSFSKLEEWESIVSMTSLTHLTVLDSSFLTNFTPSECEELFYKISQLPNLIHLKFSGSYKTYINNKALSYLCFCAQLKVFHLGYSPGVTDKGIKHLNVLHQLENFSIESENLTDKSCDVLSTLTKLTDLELKRILLSDRGFQKLCSLPNLKILHLDACPQVTNSGFQHLSLLNSLVSLEFCHNHNIDNFALSSLKKLKNLESLVLTDCNLITHEGLKFISELPELKVLDLSSCSLIDNEALKIISNLKSLNILRLNKCSLIDDEGVAFLKKLPIISEITLNECPKITDVGLNHLSSKETLKSLSFNNNRNITQQGLTLLSCLPRLKNLSIRGCPQITEQEVNVLFADDIQITIHINPKVLEAIQNPNSTEVDSEDELNDEDFSSLIYHCPYIESLRFPFSHEMTLIHLKSLELKRLRIEFCWFTDLKEVEPITSMTSLTHLSLTDWHTIKTFDRSDYEKFFEKISQLPNLIHLDFSRGTEYLDNDALKCLSSLSQLKTFYIGLTPYVTDKGVESISSFKHLEKFSLDGDISDKSCDVVSAFTKLTELELVGEFTDKGFQKLCYLNKLERLNLGKCSKVTNNGFQHLCLLNSLVSLHFCDNLNITDLALSALTPLKNLECLILSGCDLITHEGLKFISILPKLKTLKLSGCTFINNEGLKALSLMKNLIVLHLNKCPLIDDDGLAYLKTLSNIVEIKLNHCPKITDKGLEHLSTLQSLENLSIDNNKNISDEGLTYLSHLTKLKNLSICECPKITNKGLRQLSSVEVEIENL